MGITFLQVMPKDPKEITTLRAAIRNHFLAAAAGPNPPANLQLLLSRLRPAATQPSK
jgi:hypothetical protein